jgi:hypothetical protein
MTMVMTMVVVLKILGPAEGLKGGGGRAIVTVIGTDMSYHHRHHPYDFDPF